MIMENTTTYQAKLSLDNLREGISQHKFIQDIKSIDFTVSIGLTRWQKDDSGFETLFLRADRALYEAKNAGRNCVVVNIDSKDQ